MKSIFLILLFSISLNAQSALEKIEWELNNYVSDLIEQDSFPGICVSLVFNDDKQIHLAQGYADLENMKPMASESMMMSGSTGKVLFSAAFLKLVDEGTIALNDKASKYLNSYDWFADFPNSQKVTVRQLLNHTSGIPRYIFEEDMLEAFSSDPSRERKPIEAIQCLIGKDPLHEPGKSWAYSDTNYILLGLIYEQVTGKRIYDDVVKYIISPAQMENTVPSIKRTIPGLVQGYIGDFDPFGIGERQIDDKGQMKMHPAVEWTGGGFATTSGDLARALKFIHESDYLSQRKKTLLVNAVDMKSGRKSHAGYGLGSFVWSRDRQFRYGHYGFFPGYVSLVEYNPHLQYAIGVQINHDAYTSSLAKVSMAADSIIALYINALDAEMIMENFERQTECWNEGSHECYMEAYAKYDSIVTVSRAGLTHGYDAILSDYKKYFPKDKMGELYFDQLSIRRLSDDYHFTTGRFNLKLPGREDLVQGYFSTVCIRERGKWFLLTDHSS